MIRLSQHTVLAYFSVNFDFLQALSILMVAPAAYAQLDQFFTQIFNRVLVDDFRLSGTGVHENHFIPAADTASLRLTPALNRLIANNIASFPLSSTVAGVTFDWSSGIPVIIIGSLGPIFAEKAQTLGKGRINVEFNYTYLNLLKFRGLATRDFRFTFTHQDIGQPGLGDSANESDLVDLFLGLGINANIFAFSATLGVTNNLDIGMAIPFTNINLNGNANAVIDSYTFANLGNANVRFNNDPLNPDLDDNVPYHESVTGLGDLALRLKYNFLWRMGIDMAALLDIRFPTGDEKDFLGTGKTNARLLWIMSKTIGDFSPHLNIGYDRRPANLDSDEFELTVGFDQKLVTGVTYAAEFIGQFDLNRDEVIQFFPEGARIIPQQNQATLARYDKRIDLSNIPERSNDNTIDASFGFRIAPSKRFLFLGNIVVPLNDGGLRSTVAPTVGLTASF